MSFFVRRSSSVRRGPQNFFFIFVVPMSKRLHWSSLRSLMKARAFCPRCTRNDFVKQTPRHIFNFLYINCIFFGKFLLKKVIKNFIFSQNAEFFPMSIGLKSHAQEGGEKPPGIFLRGILIQDGSTKIFLQTFE